ncbi:hypothetical protein [Hymenobacter sp. APR13]|uniref:hypothetical protein n=1 Tax=Hymenobacter sp. APR13 TaxID=1356852 RepID=UPI0012E011BF|nr:hypothetical protein [Hymenobacter sp. APR13]
MKVSLLALLPLVAATAASAQKLPLPGQKNPDWTLLKTEGLYQDEVVESDQPQPVPMPNIDARGGVKDSSGQWVIYYDPLRNVRYNMADLKKGRLRAQDLRTGTVYTYAPKKGAHPKPLK